MKAKEWAEKFKEAMSKDDDTLADVFMEFVEETKLLLRERCKSPGKIDKAKISVMASCFREQKQKWLAICNLYPKIRVSMFDTLMNIYFDNYDTFIVSVRKMKL